MNRREALRAAKAELKAYGVTISYDADVNEYRVAIKGPDSEASAYYTDGIWDAIGTGKAMARASML